MSLPQFLGNTYECRVCIHRKLRKDRQHEREREEKNMSINVPVMLFTLLCIAISPIVLFGLVWVLTKPIEWVMELFMPSPEEYRAKDKRYTDTHDLFTTQCLTSGHRARQRYRGM